ncbi:MAG: hypothetical protein ACHREM_14775 [Polyangiales bacterium]
MSDAPKRNPMAIGEEPTDEELELVMRDALAVAMARKAASDAWLREQIRQAVAAARASDRARLAP